MRLDQVEVRGRREQHGFEWPAPGGWVAMPAEALLECREIARNPIVRSAIERVQSLVRANVTFNVTGDPSGPHGKGFRELFQQRWIAQFVPKFLEAFLIYGFVVLVLDRKTNAPYVAEGVGERYTLEIRADTQYRRMYRVFDAWARRQQQQRFEGETKTSKQGRAASEDAEVDDALYPRDTGLPKLWLAHDTAWDPGADGAPQSPPFLMRYFHRFLAESMTTSTRIEEARRTAKIVYENASGQDLRTLVREMADVIDTEMEERYLRQQTEHSTEWVRGVVQDAVMSAFSSQTMMPAAGGAGAPASIVLPQGVKPSAQLKYDATLPAQLPEAWREFRRQAAELYGISADQSFAQKVGQRTSNTDCDPGAPQFAASAITQMADNIADVLTTLYRLAFRAETAKVSASIDVEEFLPSLPSPAATGAGGKRKAPEDEDEKKKKAAAATAAKKTKSAGDGRTQSEAK